MYVRQGENLGKQWPKDLTTNARCPLNQER